MTFSPLYWTHWVGFGWVSPVVGKPAGESSREISPRSAVLVDEPLAHSDLPGAL